MAVSDLNKARKIKAAERQKTNVNVLRELERYGRIDLPLFFILLAIICFGLIMLFSASLSTAYASEGDPLYYVRRQLVFTLIGAILCFIFLRFPLRTFNRSIFTILVYGAGTAALLAVMLFGVEGNYGAKRWLSLGGILFQPSEMCKVAAIYCLATYFPAVRKLRARGKLTIKDNPRKDQMLETFVFFTFPALAMGVWILLILAQPHFSGAIILSLLVGTMFMVAKIPGKIWLRGILQLIPFILVGILLLALIFPILKPEQSFFAMLADKFSHVTSRLETFSNPEEASKDSTHQTEQARLALGSGGLTGKGIGMGRQKAGFLPMVYNDFILPSVGEELGFIGSFMVLALFFAYFICGVRITCNAKNLYSALMSWGGTFLIMIQALMNIAVAAEVIPPTGISLPFFSYGGTAHIFMMMAASFVLSVSKTGQRLDPELRKIVVMDQNYRDAMMKREELS